MYSAGPLRKATCNWCAKSGSDCSTAQFDDGLKGTFCKKCLWVAVSLRSKAAAAKELPADSQKAPSLK